MDKKSAKINDSNLRNVTKELHVTCAQSVSLLQNGEMLKNTTCA